MRKYLAPLKLADRQVAVLCLLAGWGVRGERQGQALLTLTITVASAKQKTGCGAGTFLAGVEDLRQMGLVDTLKVTKPFTYVVNLSRLAKLEPPEGCDPLDEVAALFSDVQGARDSVNREYISKVRDRDSVTTVFRDTGGLNAAERLRRPWARNDGVDDAMLRSAVLQGKHHILGALYREATGVLGWIQDSIDARLRFLMICHHAATCQGIHHRMGVVQARVKRGLDTAKIRHDSEAWARKVLAGRRQEARTARTDLEEPATADEVFSEATSKLCPKA